MDELNLFDETDAAEQTCTLEGGVHGRTRTRRRSFSTHTAWLAGTTWLRGVAQLRGWATGLDTRL